MKPGVTVRPAASMVRVACALLSRPISTMWSPRMPRSNAIQGLPVPSSTRPFRMSTSYRAGPCADTSHVDADTATASAEMRRNARGLRMQLMPEMVTLLLSHRQMAVARKLPSAWRNVQGNERRNVRVLERVRRIARTRRTLPPPETAKVAGLRYVNDETMPGIRRVGRANRFRYVDANGRTVADRIVLQRIRALAIPPAWTDVWICSDPNGHVQATGRDARGRKQYRYHPRWREVRDEVKYGRMIPFAEALPRVRARTNADLKKAGLPREKILAAVVQLLEKTLIRVGNDEYARENGSIGLTTMRDQHAKVQGENVRFQFRGKSGIQHSIDLQDRRLARIVKACRDLPGYELFQYVDDDGVRQVVDSGDVNDYLRAVSGEDFTA